MFKQFLLLTSFVLVLSLAANTLALDLIWDNDDGTGDSLWNTATNWTIDKTTDNKVPEANDAVIIDDLFTDAANGPIIQIGIDAVCDTLAMGQSDSPSVEAVLKMTGGTLTTGDWVSIGDDEFGDYRFDLSDGNVTIGGRFALGYARDANATFNMYGGYLSTAGDLFLGVESMGTSNPIVNINGGNVVIAEDIELAEYAGASGTINISGGTVEVGDNIYVGWEQTGPATLNMTGGQLSSASDMYIGGGDDDGILGADSYVNLDGGTLTVPWFSKYPNTTLNISGGTFIVDGDYINVANGWIWDPCAEDWEGTLASPGVVNVYGTHNYGIIDDANYPAELGKRAILLMDYDVANPGKTTVTAGAVDADLAWNEKPSNGSAWQPPVITLSWSPGLSATAHDVYFGTNYSDVENGTGDTYKYRYAIDANSYSPDGSLVLDTTYYWRIDEVNASGLPEWKGLVWNFKVAPGAAVEPYPEDEATDVPLLTILSWKPGPEAYTHQLYFSTDFDEVNDRSISYESPPANSYNPGELEFDTTYYWAVDEVNMAADVTTWYGDVWQFTTASFVSVENFNSYDDIDNPLVYEDPETGTWMDGWENGSRSALFIERDLAYDGNAVRYYYNNIDKSEGVYGSWADAYTADLQVGSDWTVGDAKALRLLFYGEADNSTTVNDRMYIALHEGTKVQSAYYPDVTDINEESWHEWHIDLEEAFPTINLENVTMITIGFGTYGGGSQGGMGTVYFDEIELWPPYCRSELFAADIDNDCVADEYDLEIMSADWLIQDYNFIAAIPAEANLIGWWKFDEGEGEFTEDSSIYENDGNAIETTWVEGHSGEPGDYALKFDGDAVVYFDRVVCAEREGDTPGIYPEELMADTFTVACWTKLDSFEYFSSFITNGIDTGDDECGFFFYNYGWNFPEDPDVKNFGLAIRTEDATGMWYVETDPVYEKDLWYHVAATYDDANTACVYINGLLAAGPTDVGGPIRWISEESGNHPENFVIGAWIDWGYKLHVNGIIDDVRYYNYAMNQGEINILAETVTPGTDVYQPVPSFANIADPEPELSRKVNFADFAVLADSWLTEQLWP